IDPVQLVKINAVQTQSAQTAFTGRSQVFRLSVFGPLIGSRTIETSFCCNHQVCRIRMQRLSDQFFTHLWTVGVCRVDEIDPEFNGPPQDPGGLCPIFGRTPNSRSSDPHCAVTQTSHWQIVCDPELTSIHGKPVRLLCLR